jgi:hypothetical protein
MEDLIVLRVQMKGTEFRHLLQLNYLQIWRGMYSSSFVPIGKLLHDL